MEKYKICQFSPYGREPVLRRMKDGSLICLFLTGGPKEPDNDNVVKCVRSEDDGKTWSSPEIVFSHNERACWSTEIFADCEKPFAIVQTYYAPSVYGEIQSYRSYISDDGKTFSAPVSLPCSAKSVSVRQGIVLSNGDILFPVYWQEDRVGYDWSNKREGDNYGRWLFTSGVIISTDGGETFSPYGRLADSDASLWEPNSVEVENGHIVTYLRYSGKEGGYLYVSESFDYGRSWTQPVKSNIPNADTKVTLVKIKDKIFMINNFTTTAGWQTRTNLAIAVSDDAKNFTKIIDVENPSERWFYPHAYVDEKQEILYLAYENASEHYIKKYTFKELGL